MIFSECHRIEQLLERSGAGIPESGMMTMTLNKVNAPLIVSP